MQKGKALLLTSSYPRFKGDYAGNFVADFAGVLLRDHDLKVLCPFDQQTDTIFKPHKIPVFYFGKHAGKISVSPFYASGGYENLSEFKRLLNVPKTLMDMLLKARRLNKNADRLVSHWMIPAGLIAALIKRKDQKHLLVIHGSDWQLLKKLPLGKKLARFIVNKADHIITVAAYQKSEIADLFSQNKREAIKKRITHMPMGINITEFNRDRSNKSQSAKPIILAAGRLVKIKGFDRLAPVLQNINCRLWIVGDGPERHELEKLFTEYGIDFKFFGMINQDELKKLYNLASVLVVPSRSMGQREEGSPRVILEAMAAKCPIVATATGGIAEFLEHEKNSLLDYSDDKELQLNIEQILESETLGKSLAENAFSKVEKLDWPKLAGKILDTLR